MKLFLCGDVMTGRGIDQIQPCPVDPALAESRMKSATGYVELAEERSGPIPRGVAPGYIWGDALDEIGSRRPDARIVNLETSVTARGEPAQKSVNYRMHPDNIACLTAAGIDCCVLANNHVGDWGTVGMTDTFATLEQAGLAMAGAGRDGAAAARPAVIETPAGRLLVFAICGPCSGVPEVWSAVPGLPGVNYVAKFDRAAFRRVAADIDAWRQPGDRVVVSVHWRGNWGYRVRRRYRGFARKLIGRAGVDVVHGHSSHHPVAIEVHRGRPILYGCGDFINDYEGIPGFEDLRPTLTLAYMVDLDDRTGRLRGLEMIPFRIRRFRLERARGEDARWLAATMDRECRRLGGRVELDAQETLRFALDANPLHGAVTSS